MDSQKSTEKGPFMFVSCYEIQLVIPPKRDPLHVCERYFPEFPCPGGPRRSLLGQGYPVEWDFFWPHFDEQAKMSSF